MSGPNLPPELRAKILGQVAREPAPTRAAGLRRDAGVIGLGLLLSLGFLFAIGGPGTYGRSASYTVTLALAWAVIAALAAWFGFGRGRSMLGRPAPVRGLVVALTPLALVVAALAVGGLSPAEPHAAAFDHHLKCLLFTAGFALAPLVAFVFVRRRSVAVAPGLGGAALGTAAGAFGALLIELRCGYVGLEHVLLGHVVPVAALAAVGFGLGASLLPVRAQRD